MTKAGYTHAVLVVDRSGSMTTIQKDAEGGVNTFIKEQKEQPGELTFTLYDFDTEFRKFIGPRDIAEVGTYRLSPRGGTALLDAIGRAMTETGEYLAEMKESDRPENVLIAIVTDGEENSSRKWTRDKVQKLIKQQTIKYNWKIIYLSSDISSVREAKDWGIDDSYVVASAGSQTYSSLSNSTSVLRSSGNLTYNPSK